MQLKKLPFVILTVLLLAATRETMGQCTALGQTAATAFPVCGTSTFKQETVPICTNGIIPTLCPAGVTYSDINPYWYKFTCFRSGTLGFLITPTNLSDDYDWQLFDVTGQNPGNVYSNPSLIVSGNWSGNPGVTGTASSGSGSTNCAGYGYPNKNAMPDLVEGHNYLLMISHFTQTQSGYSLAFAGGTASITDTIPPAIQSASPSCDGTRLQIVLNKRMQCSSLAPDGSDFILSPAVPGVTLINVSSDCSGFDMDTITAVLSGSLPPGNYTLAAQTGTDQNTILDNCGAAIPVGQSAPFTMTTPQPSLLDSLTPPGCVPDTLRLVFDKPILCSSIAADGSDFLVQGSSPVTVSGASGQCDADGLSYSVLIRLSAPIRTAGNFRLYLRAGSDGNTLINECGLATPAGSLPFATGDTVSAALLTGVVKYGCRTDTIAYGYPPVNGVDRWTWTFSGGGSSSLENPPGQLYTVFGPEWARLVVSNGYCTDSTQVNIVLNNGIKAVFETDNILCPTDRAGFADSSTGIIDSYEWDFGDGTVDHERDPPGHLFPQTGEETNYAVMLIVGDSLGCYDTAVHRINVLRSCYIAVPSAFTPNGDGLNDYLYPLNAYKADNLVFRVFNRNGMQLFGTTTWTQKWDGTFDGHPEPAGTYVWMLQYTDRDTGKHYFLKGTSILIR